jgi:hypothetical protein
MCQAGRSPSWPWRSPLRRLPPIAFVCYGVALAAAFDRLRVRLIARPAAQQGERRAQALVSGSV